MKFLRLVPLAVILAACSSIPTVPLSPYRIDVQQGNALEQESVDKLKPGLSRSQVRFLLGTPLLVDPFRNNRWDYVFNYRKGGKLTEERRLVLFFEGDVLARIEAEGFPPKGEVPEAKPAVAAKPVENPVESVKAAAKEPAPVVVPPPPASPAPVASVEPTVKPAVVAAEQPKPVVEPAPAVQTQAKSVAEPAPAAAPVLPAKAASPGERSLNETSIVQPLQAEPSKPAEAPKKPGTLSDRPPEAVALQPESNVAAIKPDVMPEFPKSAAPTSPEEQVTAALEAWANAWRTRDEEAYLAAYAANFRPEGGQSRAEWEKRRRLLLGVARNIDLKIDGVAAEAVTEDRAQVSFRQFYRSESYQDAVIKQIKFVRVDNLWLIEEEKVLAPIKVKK